MVDDEQPVRLDGPRHYRLQTVLRVRRRQRQQQIGRRHEARLDAGLPGRVPQRYRQMGLVHAAGTDEHHVFIALDEAQSSQFLDLAALYAFGKVVVELLQRF